ncbi:MAG TPA: DUF86 domain-containing protein [Caldisericia bacterium]|nr:DUF86 domain-containing protein [Caldisericia bacterium]HQL67008.1 DUF86 domain-containing protein [Caldisericia bacterium]
MNLDIEKIKKRVSEIEESINEINKIVSINEYEFWKDKRNITSVKYYLLEAIEAVGEICVHIVAKKFGKGVNSLSECINILEKEEILDKELSSRLKKMIKFRNKLIHKYWDIDDKLVYEYAKNETNDFTDFIKEIKKFLI